MSIVKKTLIIVVMCVLFVFIVKTLTNTKTIYKKPSPSFIYPLNYSLNCSGKVYFLKKNGKIDSTYLIRFIYENRTMKMNISYYGVFLKKRIRTYAPYFLSNILLTGIRYDENLSYILSGTDAWYSMRLYYKNNKQLFQSLLFALEFLYPKKFKYLIKHYKLLNNSYLYMDVKNHFPRHLELYLAFKNNSSLFYIDAKCFFKQNPFLDKEF